MIGLNSYAIESTMRAAESMLAVEREHSAHSIASMTLNAEFVIQLCKVALVALKPIDMVLHCPACGMQHLDTPNATWLNPPHRSHQCAYCAHTWRPADVPTCGVVAVKTAGKDDSPLVTESWTFVPIADPPSDYARGWADARAAAVKGLLNIEQPEDKHDN